MTSLAGIDLDNNLHLMGFESNADVSYSMRELLGGPGVFQIEPRSVPPTVSLIARNDGGSRMGQYCSHQIDALKTACALGQPVTLVHPRGSYNVYILAFNVDQADERDPPHEYKKWYGEIVMQVIDNIASEPTVAEPPSMSFDDPTNSFNIPVLEGGQS